MKQRLCVKLVWGLAVAMASSSLPCYAQPAPNGLKPAMNLRVLLVRGELDKVVEIGCRMLWRDITKPDVLRTMVLALDKLGRREQAGVFCHLLIRVLAQPQTSKIPGAAIMASWAKTQLKHLDVEYDKLRKQYERAAPGRIFDGVENVGELWMTNVEADPMCLHGLMAWPLVGGRRDVSAEWIHNAQGRMHRSGMKLMEEVDGRKGVMYWVSVNPDEVMKNIALANIERLGHRPRLQSRNVGKCRYLRMGVKPHNWSLNVRVIVDDKELFLQHLEPKQWHDLKIDLKDAGDSDAPIIIEFLVPKGQRPHEGVWIDYLDFFKT